MATWVLLGTRPLILKRYDFYMNKIPFFLLF